MLLLWSVHCVLRGIAYMPEGEHLYCATLPSRFFSLALAIHEVCFTLFFMVFATSRFLAGPYRALELGFDLDAR